MYGQYPATSRYKPSSRIRISEAAVFEAVKTGRPLGDQAPITADELWDRVAADMSEKPYKSLGVDLLTMLRRDHEKAVDGFIRADHRLQQQRTGRRQHGREIHARLHADAVRRALAGQIGALGEAIVQNCEAVSTIANHINEHLTALRASLERTLHRIEQAGAEHGQTVVVHPSSQRGPRF
jgi:hypothetical protein